jgi:hypothetical protein
MFPTLNVPVLSKMFYLRLLYPEQLLKSSNPYKAPPLAQQSFGQPSLAYQEIYVENRSCQGAW